MSLFAPMAYMEIQKNNKDLNNAYLVLKANDPCLALFSLSSLADLQVLFNERIEPELKAQGSTSSELWDIESGSMSNTSVKIYLADNREVNLELVITPSANTPGCITLGILDLTELKQTKKELRETLLRYELVVEGAYGAIWDWDVTAQTVHFSENWCKLRGGTKADFSNHQDEWLNSIYPEDRERVIGAVQAHMEGKTAIFEQEYRISCKDGSVKWISDRGIVKRDSLGNVIRMAGSEFDITEHRKTRVQSQLAASVFESIDEAVVILALDGVITDANNAFYSLFGFAEKALINKSFCDLFTPQQQAFVTGIINKRYPTSVNEINLFNHLGDAILCKVKLSPAVAKNGEVSHLIALISDIRSAKSNEQLLHNLAYRDALTKLPNRLSLVEFLHSSIRTQQAFTLFFLDIDNFKYINDALGHAAGDELLVQLADTIAASVRKEDMVARLGGDEFVVVMSNLSQKSDIERAAQQLLSNINNRRLLQRREVKTSVSIGISSWPKDADKVDSLLQNADAAMYQAKAKGKQNYQFYSQSITEKAVERVRLEADIDRAILNDEFVLHYQPQLCVENKVVKGLEALVRWQPRGQDLIYPDKFINLAEENGTIVAIGNWVLLAACRQAKAWLDEGIDFGFISVNISAVQLTEDLLWSIEQALNKTGLAARYLELEVTESSILHQGHSAISLLERIADLGISLAVDDFGTGYSSLSYLKTLPFHRLKIDRSFIKDIPEDENDVAITEAIIVLSKKLGLEVIAEGTENSEQVEFLLQRGCQMAQGYYFSKPLPAQQITEYLLAHT